MEKLMPHHALRKDYDFDDYAKNIYMKDKPCYGSYWEHVNVSMYLKLGISEWINYIYSQGK